MKQHFIFPLAALFTLACTEPAETATPETFLLVHGAFQDASSWDAVTPLLEDEGHRVVTVELPGRGQDATPHAEISLESHVGAIQAALDGVEGPVVLVGHSFGGISASVFADRKPTRVRRLVYLASYIPREGESLASLAEEDLENGFNENNFLISDDYATASVLASDRRDLFCNDCTEPQATKLLGAFHDEPLGPMGTPVELAGGLGGVSKVYVKTAKDRALSPAMQQKMLSRHEVTLTLEIDSGHTPFLTAPTEVVRALTTQP